MKTRPLTGLWAVSALAFFLVPPMPALDQFLTGDGRELQKWGGLFFIPAMFGTLIWAAVVLVLRRRGQRLPSDGASTPRSDRK